VQDLEGHCFGEEDIWSIKNAQRMSEIFRFSNHGERKTELFEDYLHKVRHLDSWLVPLKRIFLNRCLELRLEEAFLNIFRYFKMLTNIIFADY